MLFAVGALAYLYRLISLNVKRMKVFGPLYTASGTQDNPAACYPRRANLSSNPFSNLTNRLNAYVDLTSGDFRNDARRKLVIEFSFVSGKDLRTVSSLRTKREIRVDEWHKVELRVQNASRMIKVLVDDILVEVQLFEYAIDKLPNNAQLRLAQTYLPAAEGLPMITSRFQVHIQPLLLRFID